MTQTQAIRAERPHKREICVRHAGALKTNVVLFMPFSFSSRSSYRSPSYCACNPFPLVLNLARPLCKWQYLHAPPSRKFVRSFISLASMPIIKPKRTESASFFYRMSDFTGRSTAQKDQNDGINEPDKRAPCYKRRGARIIVGRSKEHEVLSPCAFVLAEFQARSHIDAHLLKY